MSTIRVPVVERVLSANDAIAALQRASAQNTNDLNATRALAQQLQGVAQQQQQRGGG